MSNRFFTNIIDLITGNKARSTEVEANFSQIEAGFDALATEYDATLAGLASGKVSKSGDTYTGSHDMTGASVDVATPVAGVSNNRVVNMSALLSALSAVVSTPAGVVTNVPLTTATATTGQWLSLNNVAATVVTANATPADNEEFAVRASNGLTTNSVDFGAKVIQGPTGSLNIITLDTPYGWYRFKYSSTLNVWMFV